MKMLAWAVALAAFPAMALTALTDGFAVIPTGGYDGTGSSLGASTQASELACRNFCRVTADCTSYFYVIDGGNCYAYQGIVSVSGTGSVYLFGAVGTSCSDPNLPKTFQGSARSPFNQNQNCVFYDGALGPSTVPQRRMRRHPRAVERFLNAQSA